MTPTAIALVGLGEIARREHVPAIAHSDAFALVAAVTHGAPAEGVPTFASITDMKAAVPDVAAVAICTPPRGRLALVAEALANGLDVMVEKPPAATLREARAFVDMAAEAGRVLYVSWHSRAAAGVEPARAWLQDKTLERARVSWKEDVRVWHPDQPWIWEPGIGVFDPGVNAFSVVTRILPGPLMVAAAELHFPANKAAPIAADLTLANPGGLSVDVAFDFDQRDGPPTWDIEVETDAGVLRLTEGASRMAVGARPVDVGETTEYARVYARFAELLEDSQSDADLTPFELVADAFVLGRRSEAAPFDDF